MMQSKKIAVTGGIGSGKSAFCAILRSRGYAVFSCDEISACLWKDGAYLKRLAENFPDCCENGKIDKGRLTQKVFAETEARKRLDKIAHPAIMEQLLGEMSAHAVSFGEVPLLFEENLEGLFDGVIALRRPMEQRIASVRARDGLDEKAIAARMAVQLDAAELDGRDCFLIENDGTPQSLERGAIAALRHFGIS